MDGLVGPDQVNKRYPLKPGSWAFVFSDMFVYVCEGAYIIPALHLRDANALVVALAFYSKRQVLEPGMRGKNQQPQLVPSHTWSCRRMKPLELATTNSVRSSIPRSRHVRVKHFRTPQPLNFFADFKIYQLRTCSAENSLYPTPPGLSSRSWLGPHFFARKLNAAARKKGTVE